MGSVGLTTAFQATAVIAALALSSWLVTLGVISDELNGHGWETVEVVAGSFGALFTVWLAAGIVALVGIIATLVRGRAMLLRRPTSARSEVAPPPSQTANRTAARRGDLDLGENDGELLLQAPG